MYVDEHWFDVFSGPDPMFDDKFLECVREHDRHSIFKVSEAPRTNSRIDWIAVKQHPHFRFIFLVFINYIP